MLVVYAAFEWDHVAGSKYIQWVVIECAGIGQLYGGVQALAPRRDIAYFVDAESAEADARLFAELKNQNAAATGRHIVSADCPDRHEAFNWDHAEGRNLFQWAVLKHRPVTKDGKRVRQDMAYFLDSATAQADATLFAEHKNALLEKR
jgi:hypothetical protein